MIKSKSKNRSGITLLFVISMIVLFLLMGASFVIMTTQFRRSVVDRSRVQTRRDDARTLVSRAFYDLFRGPTLDNPFSPLRGHSLLGDQYGYGAKAYVRTSAYVGNTGDQFIVVQLDSAPDVFDANAVGPVLPGHQFFPIYTDDNDFLNPTNHFDFSNQGGTYDGQVVTFTTGPAAGVSTRVVSYTVSFDGMGNVLNRQFVLFPQWDDQNAVFTNVGSLVNSEVVINGRDFSGTGAGFYTAATPTNNAALSNEALLPNRMGEGRIAFLNGYMGSPAGANPFAFNEDYDAVDFQNMFLAAVKNEDGDGVIDPLGIIPSFHRPQLISYHQALGTPNPDSYSMRVTQNSNGGNFNFPTANLLDPPEVDNDLDAVADGIWLDIGLPLQTDMKGRVFKPLVSYLVVDMDGKFNINAQGNQADIDPATGNAYVTQRVNLLGSAASGGTISSLHRGSGYGPPEINMGSLFGFLPGSDYELLLNGSPAGSLVDIPGRYGFDDVPGGANAEVLSLNKWYSHPTNAIDGYFGSPMDAIGRYGIGVADFFRLGLLSDPYDPMSATFDVPAGFPVIDALTSNWGTTPGLGLGTELVNAPYEMNFSRQSFTPSGASADTPFSPREMERVLRLFDPDAVMLPSRLRLHTQRTVDAGISARMAFSTASFEVPVPPTHLVTQLRQILIDTNNLDGDGDGVIDNPADELFVRDHVNLMLSPDLVKGLKMDPNRPFGNGSDDDGDGEYDESWHPDAGGNLIAAQNESQAGESLVQAGPGGTVNTTFDHDNDGIIAGDADAHLVHQYFARHLYVLTLLTTQYIDRNGDGAINTADWYDYNNDGATDIDDIYAYRMDIAQWAINVANFRDRDSIMHPFEFDLNPWDGWDVNHILNDNVLPDGSTESMTLTQVAWGVERPEMLLTETLAMHDRKTEDRDDDDGSGETTTAGAPATPDDDLDSALVPTASFFVELYNPWINSGNAAVNANSLSYPAELYDGGLNGIDLQRTSTIGNSPVWQVLVAQLDPGDPTTIDANPDNGVLQEARILRRVYFTKPDPTEDMVQFGTNKVYFPDNAITANPLAPGGYAIVGSAGIESGDRYHTYLGRRSTATWATELEGGTDETRRITLDTDASVLELRYFDTVNASWELQTRPAIVLPIGRQENGTPAGKDRSLGVTDPIDGYDVALAGVGLSLNPVADGFQLVDAALTPVVRDVPIDFDLGAANGAVTEWASIQNDGIHNTDQLLRVIHLRRLANPGAPYDPVLNPYLTVDSLGAPVNVFNGVSAVDEVGSAPLTMDFTSRERGANDAVRMRDRLFWRADQDGLDPGVVMASPPAGGDLHFHSFNLENSLGEIDVAYRTASTNAFPWLTWNNRPYVSHLELANVPFTSSYRLLSRTDYEPNPFDDYDTYVAATTDPNRDVFSGRFKHLPGFHCDAPESPWLYRVMDYLEVPSRFIGTETYFNPAVFDDSGLGAGLGFSPPFNKFSNYRYPGKINLNTVFDARVWNGLMRNYSTQVDYATFNMAREGLNTIGTIPTEFAAPFRAAENGNRVPQLAGANPHAMVAGRRLGADARGADAGMFRRNALTGDPLLDVTVNPGPHADPDRNAYFRNDMRQRLGNLTTNRSSVFSIWITIGFFEVDENLQLGAEVGSDTGDVQRYRGFYMVDRSIPVGFEPGFNHNVDQAILTSSIIERAVSQE